MDIPMNITEHPRERLDLQGRKGVVIAYEVDHFNDDDKSTSSNASTVSTDSENKIRSCDIDIGIDIDAVTEHYIEFEKDDLALFEKNGSKYSNNTNNNETDTDTCTTAVNTMMLDLSSCSSFDHDDEEPLLLFSSTDSEYDVFEEGDDDEEDDISIIIEDEDHDDDDDMMIIKVQELPSITSSLLSVTDDDDDDNSCLSTMIDNRREQFEFDLLEVKRDDIFFQFDNTSSNTEPTTSTTKTSETLTPITTIVVVTEEVDVIEFQDHHHWQEQQTSQHVTLITVVLSLLLLFSMIGSSTVFIASDGIIQMKAVTRMASTSATDNTLFIPERINSMNLEATVLPVPILSRYGFHNKEETTDDDDDDDDATVALYDVALARSDTIDTVSKRRKKNKKSRLPLVLVPTKVVCRIVKQILTNLIRRKWSTESPTELMIDVRPSQSIGRKHHKKNNLLQLLFRGQIHADAALSSGPIIFDVIRFSSIKLELEQVTVNLFSFLSSKKNRNRNKIQLQRRRLLLNFVNKYQRIIAATKKNRSNKNNTNKNNNKRDQQRISKKSKKKNKKQRFPNQFEIRIEELTMSRHDLLLSSSVRNGLRQLLIKVLQDRGIVDASTIQITSIDILPTGKISCQGDAQTLYGSTRIPFEVRTGITVDETGRILLFPGLEVSLMSMRDIGLFIPVSFYTTLSLYVGHHTKFHTIVVDGKQKRIKIGASVTVNNTSNNNNSNDSTLPHSISTTTVTVTSSVATTYSSAKFFYDMGRGLTKLGNFSN